MLLLCKIVKEKMTEFIKKDFLRKTDLSSINIY